MADLLEARARALAVRHAELTAVVANAIVVTIAAQRYAFPVEQVRRVAVVGPITRLPHLPPIVLGLASCDGEVMPIFDACVWCGFASRAASETTNVLILGAASPLALAVDGLAGTTTLEALDPLPPSSRKSWLRGVTSEGVFVVDVPAVLEDPVFSGAAA